MAECIEREAFKKSVEEHYCKPCKVEGKDHNGCWCRACWVDDMLDEVECFQPSDVTLVTRCKNCKFSHADEHGRTCEGYWFELSEYAVSVKDDAFCSYGERRDDA